MGNYNHFSNVDRQHIKSNIEKFLKQNKQFKHYNRNEVVKTFFDFFSNCNDNSYKSYLDRTIKAAGGYFDDIFSLMAKDAVTLYEAKLNGETVHLYDGKFDIRTVDNILNNYFTGSDKYRLNEAIDVCIYQNNHNYLVFQIKQSFFDFLKKYPDEEVMDYLKYTEQLTIEARKNNISCTQFDILAEDAYQVYQAGEDRKNCSLTGGKIEIEGTRNLYEKYLKVDGFEQDEVELPSIDDKYL